MSTIKQKSVTLDFDGKTVEVRRMQWKSAREFLKKFAAASSTVYKDAPAEITLGALLIQKLPEIVSGSDELILLLIRGSTDLSAEQFGELDLLAAMEILGASLKVNFDDEAKKCLAGIGAEVAALMPAKAKTN